MTARLNPPALAFSTIVGFANSQPTVLGTSVNALIPVDDTIPQNTEGAECMSAGITPKAIGNILVVDAVALLSHSAANAWLTGAIFLNSAPNALAAMAAFAETAGGGVELTVRAYHTVVDLNLHTFRFRAGPHINGTMTFNGTSATRLFGGIGVSSLQVMELAP